MTPARTIPSPSGANVEALLTNLSASLNAYADTPDVMAILTGFEKRVSQIVTDMQAVAKASPVMAEVLHDAICELDDYVAGPLAKEIRLLEAAQDAKDDAEEARGREGMRSDYFRAVAE